MKYLLMSVVVALAGSISPASTLPVTKGPKLIAYYMHGATRCSTCRKIEAMSQQTLAERFAPELKNGALTWRVLSFDKPENKHFIKDFGLFASSLVLVRQDQPRRWKNLEHVWDLAGNPKKFAAYVEIETRALLKDKP